VKGLNLFAVFVPVLFLGGGYLNVLCDPDGRLQAETADYTQRDACVAVKTVAVFNTEGSLMSSSRSRSGTQSSSLRR
jgi:hypothetical protein